VVHATERGEALEKIIAEGGLKPGKVISRDRRGPGLTLLFKALLAENAPLRQPVAQLDTPAHKIATLGCESKVLASLKGWGSAKRAELLIDHGMGR
jgi:hypothetical protein